MTNTSTTETVELVLSWDAYIPRGFYRVYDKHADRLGGRPIFTVCNGGDHARVITTAADADAARAIIAELERAVANA